MLFDLTSYVYDPGRLSTIVNSDKIFVIHRGQVAEWGTHSELLEKRGTYYKLWNKNVTL